ncbi:acyltransferase family protein [Microbacterium sp. JZ31]|uniref:acyltransferase family protein n=1 Tax=Microbacterium sp. JZ31 TaxID=1906274 RepID=UPI0019344D23|nr:acyltransferase [Microbacterium sp. JZ31]
MTSISPSAEGARPGIPTRLPALDGLRGIAALVVMIHHSLLTVPMFAAAYYDSTSEDTWRIDNPALWFAHTPLHVLWDGKFAVMIFFILSGFVLTLPVLRATSFRWDAYLPQRLARLYLPVWGALLFALAVIFLTPRGRNQQTEWLVRRADPVSFQDLLQSLAQISGGNEILSPLWTIRWEILFSLLLGAFVWIGLRTNGNATVIACLVLIAAGSAWQAEALMYLPMFLIGVVLAVHRETLHLRLGPLRGWLWGLGLAAAVLLASAPWMMPPSVPERVHDGALALQVAGALIVVAFCAFGRPRARLLCSRPAQWLGTISFSLYLVHETVVVLTADLFGPGESALVLPVAAVASLGAAQLFFVGVERPSHLLSRRVFASIADERDQQSSR